MSTYDIDKWLTSSSRALKDYILAAFDVNLVTVELNFPDTQKLMPLEKTLIHLEQDDMEHPVVGFGIPTVEVFDDVAGTVLPQDLAVHHVNYDIGVWASRESGGASHRMEVTEVLSSLFAPAAAKQAFREATGMSVVSFNGGRNELDRLDDTPVWRMLDMTLVVRVVSRNVPLVADIIATDITQDQELTITNDTGDQSPVT